jgi:hypothetical protein
MDQDLLAQRLELATKQTLEFTQQDVWNVLPARTQYLVFPSRYGAQHTVQTGEMVFLEDAQRNPRYVGPLDVAGVVAFLWREGFIPAWIDMSVYAVDETTTYLELLCCARFTNQERLLYYRDSATCPILVCGPHIPPPGWENEKDGKFDLHWRHKIL